MQIPPVFHPGFMMPPIFHPVTNREEIFGIQVIVTTRSLDRGSTFHTQNDSASHKKRISVGACKESSWNANGASAARCERI
jgi:hypothetical protein